MLVKLDDEILFEIDEVMIKLLGHDLVDPIDEIKRRLRWVIEHKCDQCFSRMEKEYMDVLRKDPEIESIPKNRRDLLNLIVNHKDYKDRKKRDEQLNIVRS